MVQQSNEVMKWCSKVMNIQHIRCLYSIVHYALFAIASYIIFFYAPGAHLTRMISIIGGHKRRLYIIDRP